MTQQLLFFLGYTPETERITTKKKAVRKCTLLNSIAIGISHSKVLYILMELEAHGYESVCKLLQHGK